MLVGGGAGAMTHVEPLLDALAVVGDAGGRGDGVTHEIERDRTAKMSGDGEAGRDWQRLEDLLAHGSHVLIFG